MRKSLVLVSAVFGLLLYGCNHQSPIAPSKETVTFEITDLKKESDTKNFEGAAFIKVKGVVRVKGDTFKDKTLMLLLKHKVTFKNSGVTDDNASSVLVRDGSGLIDTSVYFTADEAKAIGSEISSANIAWEAVGYFAIHPAKVENR